MRLPSYVFYTFSSRLAHAFPEKRLFSTAMRRYFDLKPVVLESNGAGDTVEAHFEGNR